MQQWNCHQLGKAKLLWMDRRPLVFGPIWRTFQVTRVVESVSSRLRFLGIQSFAKKIKIPSKYLLEAFGGMSEALFILARFFGDGNMMDTWHRCQIIPRPMKLWKSRAVPQTTGHRWIQSAPSICFWRFFFGETPKKDRNDSVNIPGKEANCSALREKESLDFQKDRLSTDTIDIPPNDQKLHMIMFRIGGGSFQTQRKYLGDTHS